MCLHGSKHVNPCFGVQEFCSFAPIQGSWIFIKDTNALELKFVLLCPPRVCILMQHITQFARSPCVCMASRGGTFFPQSKDMQRR